MPNKRSDVKGEAMKFKNRVAFCRDCDHGIKAYWSIRMAMYCCPVNALHSVSTISLNPNYQEVA